ncbi:MAG: hypothetical protein LBT09_15085 [Planctomycetaceae bacterium]|nr:hypothetical protein [Planctomycetaceae bacterium]
MSPLQDVETQCIASLLCYPAVSLCYTAGYAHFIPAGLGKKTIKIKITLTYYQLNNYSKTEIPCAFLPNNTL